MKELDGKTASELVAHLESGEISPVDAASASLGRIERFNEAVNAFAYIVAETAIVDARASETRWVKKRQLSFADGLPTTIKEMTSVKGIPLRRGSNLTSREPAQNEYLLMQRVRKAGLTVIGTTTSPEFGWKGVTHGPAFGNTLNPWSLDRASGGSSGGAAVAAALNMGVLHEGSDGAGSIRIPASFCGVVGFKPSHGIIPWDTPAALFELPHRGPLARSVADAAIFMALVAGPSPLARYGYCPADLPDWRKAAMPGDLKGVRIAYSPDLGYAKVQPAVAAAVDAAARRFADLGASVEEVDPGFQNPQDALLALWYSSEASELFELTPNQRSAMDPGLVAIYDQGMTLSARDFIAAEEVRSDLKVRMALFHEAYDLLLTPTMPITAFEAGQDFPGEIPGKDWSDWSPFTYPFNMTGQPAISIPCGFDPEGLPIGLQLVGAKYNDGLVLKAAATYEHACPQLFPNEPTRPAKSKPAMAASQ
jgi:aspartyl-tRNA(Asn)/glutamyl-tRNA(Gln) amidotransferase subunit A